MSSFEGTWGLSWDAMRSSFSLFRGGRAVSRPNTVGEHKVWSPLHGIVFAKTPAESRYLSTAVAEDLVLHSNAEDRYVKASEEGTLVDIVAAAAADEPLEEPVTEAEAESEEPEQQELPKTTSSFTMSEEVFRAAKNAESGSPESFWTHTLYRGPEQDGVAPKVKVHYCRSKRTTERTLQQYFMDKKILGFDIEWQAEAYRNSGIKKNVSLVQLASDDRIGLFHIALYPKDDVDDLVAPSLRTIMEDPSVIKVGVSIRADCTRLRKYLKIDCRGIFELSHLHKLVKFSSSRDFKLINKRLVRLSAQVEEHLHLPLYKGGEVRSSDWSQPLQLDQIVYAASDSYAGLRLFDTLEVKRKELDPVPPRPFNVEEDKPIRLAEGIEIPTDDELEPEETEIPVKPQRAYTKRSPSFYNDESVEIENLDPDFSISVSPPNTPAPTTRSKSSKSPAQPKSPLVTTAALIADSYRSSHPQNKATFASLRCYFLWYNNRDLSLTDIAGLLREPPLQSATIVNYILESVRVEKLPFEKERLKEVLAELPKEIVSRRYRTLSRACDAEGVGKSKD